MAVAGSGLFVFTGTAATSTGRWREHIIVAFCWAAFFLAAMAIYAKASEAGIAAGAYFTIY